MKHTLLCFCIGWLLCITGSVPVVTMMTIMDDTMEFWGVVVVNVDQTKEPYIYDALMQSETWDHDHLKLLWKEETSRQAILASLEWLGENADEHDTVLFAGDIHGIYYHGEYGIWPFDGSSEGIISVEELDQHFDRINAKNFCLIFDSCFSGNFIDEMDTGLTRSNRGRERDFVEGIEGENRVVIMSSLRNGLAAHWYNDFGYEGEISLSSCLAEALAQNIDYNTDGVCSAEEAFAYAKEKIFPMALRVFFNLPVQIIMWLVYGSIFKPFPNMYDPSPEELPLIYIVPTETIQTYRSSLS